MLGVLEHQTCLLLQFSFVPIHWRHTIGSVLYPNCFLAGLGLYYWHLFTQEDGNDCTLLPEIFVRIQIGYYIVRRCWGAGLLDCALQPCPICFEFIRLQCRQLVIGIKYAGGILR